MTHKGFIVTGSVCDATSCTDREQLLEKVSFVFNGKLNILINNVGTNIMKPALEYTAEEYSFLMATNLISLCIQMIMSTDHSPQMIHFQLFDVKIAAAVADEKFRL
ncbi:hypothetical protein L2E82_16240 [Cichorium intybus]|uniref:Uncharacterized protein n=1 Tax=Cichorium intybus TaxID=13427 RepID=A0ACB9F5Y8_CICIN|nr:hypothetical protein L2E82_16240 [Cichorium intybus]